MCNFTVLTTVMARTAFDLTSAQQDTAVGCTTTQNMVDQNKAAYQDVTTQIWATLYDYPCLKKSAGLAKYIESCVRTSWGLVNQIPQYTIEYDGRLYDPDLHARFHQADASKTSIRTYLWPALREGKSGPCVHKAVVIT